MTIGKLIRADPRFVEILNDIKIKRIKKGLDKQLKTTSRMTLAITRHESFDLIKKDLLSAKLK